MFGERFTDRPAALERAHRRRSPRRGLLGPELVFGGGRFELLELQLELVEEPRLALRLLTIELAPQLEDLELEGGDHGFAAGQHRLRSGRRRSRARSLGLGRLGPRLGGGERRAQGIEIFSIRRHDFDCTR
jgi:hypothetical protein